MKVLSLCCAHEHPFEGWFASEDDFQSQLERQLVECPMCGDKAVRKLPSAPRLNVSGAREPAASTPQAPAGGNTAQGSQAGDRTLAGAAAESLCFAWSMPGSSGNGFQGAATTATFNFSAEQTVNNP